MNKGLPQPDKQYKWGKWRAYLYNGTQTVMLMRQDGKTYIIKPETDVIRNVPIHIQRKLMRIGFLKQWRETQLKKAWLNLKTIREQHERFLHEQNRTATS